MVKQLAVIFSFALTGCVSAPVLETPPANRDAAQINLQLGIGYIQTGRFDVAQDKLKKALEYDSTLTEAHNALAIIYEETGEKTLADREYQQAIQKNPQYTLARTNYGRFLCAHGKANEGEGQFLLAIADPELKNADAAYAGAGTCARILGATERAEQYFRKALELNPFSAAALIEFASLSHEQGQQEQARQLLQRYHSVASYSPASLWLGISIEKNLGNNQLRQEYQRLLLSKFADSQEARQLTQSE